MASSFTFKPLRQQTQLQISSFTHCKYFKFHFSFQSPTFSPTEHTLLRSISPIKAKVTANDAAVQLPRTTLRYGENGNGVSSSTSINERISKNFEKNPVSTTVDEPVERRVTLSDRDMNWKKGLVSKNKREIGSVGEKSARKTRRSVSKVDKDKIGERLGKKEKGFRIKKVDTLAGSLRVGLDMCSKSGDVMGAIRLYELAKRDGIKMSQYHYAVLLYLCSSAATGIVRPAKSGTGSRSLSPVNVSNENSNVAFEDLGEMGEISNGASHRLGVNGFPNSNETLDELVESMKKKANNASSSEDDRDEQMGNGIQVSEDVKKLALKKGYEIHEEMCVQNVPMNEATLTSVARMAMSLGDGEMAFDMVKQMKQLGINPRLRSYGPALSVFCSKGDVEKAFEVEKHMLEHGVDPEEPELEALLKASIEAGKSDKVYYLLHKLRTSVRKVSPATADLIELWFKSKVASKVGKRKWDKELIIEAIKNGGGGWHGQGWLGKGKWTVSRTLIGSDSLCKSCGEKLVTIDLDPVETENFAESVAAIASQREKHSSFQNFQRWLDYHGPFEAVVDAANIGLYSQRKFKPSKVNAVVNGIRQMLPSRKWPLIVLHNRRLTGEKMDEPYNRAIIEKWKDVGALYATPTGSNDDWYWLYAAIKFKCLLVTNDEMRDHLFQLLGNDFFPRWKERHQVHFTFSENGPVFHMPPPYSVVIQESEKGHWHVPIESEVEHEDQRTWLCITRAQSSLAMEQGLAMSPKYVVSEEKHTIARVSKFSNTELIEKVLKEFDEKQKTDFKASCLGHLSELPKSKYSGQLIQLMANRIIICRKMNEVWFMVNEKCLRFGMQEFTLVTGLNCNDIPTGPEVEKIINKHRIYDKYFQGTKKISVADLEKKFHGCKIKNDKYKLGLALIVEGVLIAKERVLGISMETLSIVDDLPFFFSYPWGRISYDLLIKSLKRPWATKADMVKINDRMSYVLYGFPASLQAWVYEAIPELGSTFAKRIGDVLPRIMRWEGIRQTQLTTYECYIKNNTVHVWATLRPTEDEQQKHYWTSIKLPSDFADEVFDKIVSEITEIQEAVPLVPAPSGGEHRDPKRRTKSGKAPSQSDKKTGNDDVVRGKSMHACTFDVAVIQELLDSHTGKIEKKIDDSKEEFNQRLDSIENKLKHHVTPSRVDSF